MPRRRAPARRSPCPAASRRRPSPPSGSPDSRSSRRSRSPVPASGSCSASSRSCSAAASSSPPASRSAIRSRPSSPAVTDATGVSGAGPDGRARGRRRPPRAWPAARHRRGSAARARRGRGARHRHPLARLVAAVPRRPARRRRRRTRRTAQRRERAASDRAIDDWDELSRGDDPTDDPTDDRPRPIRRAAADDPDADGAADCDRGPTADDRCRPGAPGARRPGGRREPDRTQPLDWPPKPRNEGAS